MDYSQLPEELIEKIVTDHLEAYSQFMAFSGVCRPWRSAAFRLHPIRRPRLPGLLVPTPALLQNPLEAHYSTHEFYPLTAVSPAIPPSPPSIPSQSRPEAYYNSHKFYDLTAVSPAIPPPPPRIPHASLCFSPDPSKISDVLAQRGHFLDFHHNLANKVAAGACNYRNYRANYYDLDDPYGLNWGIPHCLGLGSKDGWIFRTFPTYCRGLYLLNPVTGASIPLCPYTEPCYLNSTKAIISCSPDDYNEQCHVFLVPCWGAPPRIAWCEVSAAAAASGQGWKFIEYSDSPVDDGEDPIPTEAIYVKGKLYVAEWDRVFIVDHDLIKQMPSSSSSSPVTKIPFSEAMGSAYFYDFETRTDHHLCHLNGQLHVILRRTTLTPRGPNLSFLVFKLLLRDGGDSDSNTTTAAAYHWEEVRSLEGHGVFLGPHETLSIPAAAGDGVRGDHIYFTWEGTTSYNGENWGYVYDLVNQKLEKFALRRDPSNYKEYSPGFWFLPMPWDISNKNNAKKAAWKGREYILGTTANYDHCSNSNNVTEWWRLPKNAIKNHQHDDDDVGGGDEEAVEELKRRKMIGGKRF